MIIPSPVSRKRARIEIIPLIDIIFFLLATFVMISLSMVKNQGLNVNLPSASTAVAQDRRVTVTITVTKDNDVYLNQEKISLDVLTDRLKELKNQDPALKVFINGDKQAYFQGAITVLDKVRAAGITRVAIQTKGTVIASPAS
jgi:biopolymer transport protein ExbD